MISKLFDFNLAFYGECANQRILMKRLSHFCYSPVSSYVPALDTLQKPCFQAFIIDSQTLIHAWNCPAWNQAEQSAGSLRNLSLITSVTTGFFKGREAAEAGSAKASCHGPSVPF